MRAFPIIGKAIRDIVELCKPPNKRSTTRPRVDLRPERTPICFFHRQTLSSLGLFPLSFEVTLFSWTSVSLALRAQSYFGRRGKSTRTRRPDTFRCAIEDSRKVIAFHETRRESIRVNQRDLRRAFSAVTLVTMCAALGATFGATKTASGTDNSTSRSNETAAPWNPKAAAAYLDQRERWWMGWQDAAREHGTFCISCHTSVPYAL